MAIARKNGFERLLLVMNDAHGPATELPFDLKSHSFPITYTLTDADAADKVKVKAATVALADRLAEKLKPMLDDLLRADAEKARAGSEAEAAAARTRAEAKWKAFDQRVNLNKFCGLIVHWVSVTGAGEDYDPPKHSYITVSVTPVRALIQRLDLRAKGAKELRPMRANRWNTDVFGHSITHFSGNTGKSDTLTAVELDDDGCLFAARQMVGGPTKEGQQVCYLEAEERLLINSLCGYVAALRGLGVAGPLTVRITLIGLAGALILPHDQFVWDISGLRPMEHDTTVVGPYTIPADFDGVGNAAMAAVLKDGFRVVWLDGGMDDDPCFTNEGHYDSD
jgi:hypothetical protein